MLSCSAARSPYPIATAVSPSVARPIAPQRLPLIDVALHPRHVPQVVEHSIVEGAISPCYVKLFKKRFIKLFILCGGLSA
jgi:hypothetical protein